MSFMTEKKAQETFEKYMQAELSGDDTLSVQLEHDLNDAGWYITSGPDGPTIAKKDSNIPLLDWSLAPKESNISPTPPSDNPNAKTWRTVGIVVLIAIGVALAILASVKIYRSFKNKQYATGQ